MEMKGQEVQNSFSGPILSHILLFILTWREPL